MTGIQQSPDAYSFLQRDANRQRQIAQEARTLHQVGKVAITAGTEHDESTVLVPFANVFTEEPIFTYGSVLDPASPPVPGKFPTASVTVVKWSLIQVGPAKLYGGAMLGIVTSGVVGQVLYIHYDFLGMALSYGLGVNNAS